MSCCGNCSGCSGCAGSLELTREEMDFLTLLGQVAFLPVVRRPEDAAPVYPEDSREQTGRMLQCLETKGLISLDYDRPLKGCDPAVYAGWRICGSMALTRRGQTVLELLEYQGFTE